MSYILIQLTRIENEFSCTFLVTSFKKGISRALRKKEQIDKNFGGGGGGEGVCDDLSAPIAPEALIFPICFNSGSIEASW